MKAGGYLRRRKVVKNCEKCLKIFKKVQKVCEFFKKKGKKGAAAAQKGAMESIKRGAGGESFEF